jgi:hypothetical protein
LGVPHGTGTSRSTREGLKYRKIFRYKTRPTKSFLRNYDMLAVPDSQISGNIAASRLALHALTCPVFGRYKISDGQLDALAAAWRQASTDGFVSSVVGNAFRRQDMMRWVTNRLNERGIRMVAGKPKRPMWLIIVDESYYFCFPRHNYHEAAGRDRHAERLGMLPPVIGAAMVFAAVPKPDEIVWDPVAGSGSLLSEAAEQIPLGTLIATDIDAAAVKLASRTLQRCGNATALRGDATSIELPRRDLLNCREFTVRQAVHRPTREPRALWRHFFRTAWRMHRRVGEDVS